MGTDCKSVGDAFVGSNPTLPTIKQALFPKEQPKNQIRPRSSAAEHFFGKEEVTDSILVEGSSFWLYAIRGGIDSTRGTILFSIGLGTSASNRAAKETCS